MKHACIAALAGILLLAGSCKKGDQGPPGNANVKTTTITVTNAQWVWGTPYSFTPATGSGLFWFTRCADIPVAAITADVVQKEHVLVYFTPFKDSANSWTPLPYQILAVTSNFYYNFAFDYSPGKIRLFYYWTPNVAGGLPAGLSTYNIPDYQFKYVIVAGSMDKAMKRAGVDVNNFREVEAFVSGFK